MVSSSTGGIFACRFQWAGMEAEPIEFRSPIPILVDLGNLRMMAVWTNEGTILTSRGIVHSRKKAAERIMLLCCLI